jgi:acyl-CoA thioester hydrolase
MKAAETRIRVRYAETDQMGVVYYANYLIWMEVGRVEYCRWRGFNYHDMEREDGVLLAVVEASCRYRSPARYDDEVVIKTRVENASRRMITFVYEMRAAEGGRVLATGSTRHAFLDRQLRLCKLPEKYSLYFDLDS